MTAQRRIISEIIKTSPDHLTSEQIYFLAKKRMPAISLGTVYRNLSVMTSDGEIVRILLPGMPDHYDKNTVPHQHMYCEACGKLEDIDIPGLDTLVREAAGDDISSYTLSVKCMCKECKKKRTMQNMPL